MASEAEMLEPWRKNFNICKPYVARDKADAERFLREFEEGRSNHFKSDRQQ